MWVWCSVALGAMPSVTVDWKGDSAQVSVQPPGGEELSAEAPADLHLAWDGHAVQIEAHGADLERGVGLWGVRGAELDGALRVSVCRKSDGLCRVLDLAVHGQVPEARKGTVALDVAMHAPEPEAAHASPFQRDAAEEAERAFAAARASGGPVLLDFSAVWCPPCNVLAAEVLHADPAPAALDAYAVAVLDADDPTSFALKSRYAIGGYPTVVLVDAEGAEISRQVGYPGRDAFVSWLADNADREDSDLDLLAADPATYEPADAARVAWTLARRGHDEIEPWLERAAGADTVELRLARMQQEPTADDAAWLCEHASERAMDWVFGALGLAEEDPELVGPLRDALRAALPDASALEAADLLYAVAQLAPDDEKATHYAAAAMAVRSGLTGAPERDRGQYTWLASLLAKSGDLPGALELLDSAVARFPGEPTFSHKAARLLLDAERAADAEAYSAAALEASWGDNRLWVAQTHAEVLIALERTDQAHALVREVLAEGAAPDPELQVRAHKYRSKLEALLEEG